MTLQKYLPFAFSLYDSLQLEDYVIILFSVMAKRVWVLHAIECSSIILCRVVPTARHSLRGAEVWRRLLAVDVDGPW